MVSPFSFIPQQLASCAVVLAEAEAEAEADADADAEAAACY